MEAGGEVEEITEQLEKELESYKAEKPWRERQEMEEGELEGDSGGDVEAIITDEPATETVESDEAPAKDAAKPRRPF